MWINEWVAGKAVSLVNMCQGERFRDKYRTHYKAYVNVMFTLLYSLAISSHNGHEFSLLPDTVRV